MGKDVTWPLSMIVQGVKVKGRVFVLSVVKRSGVLGELEPQMCCAQPLIF